MSGTDAASFDHRRAAPGRLQAGVRAWTLDFEGKRTYRVSVEVTDGTDENGDDDMDAIDDRQNVTITVTNRQRGAHVITGDTATASFTENGKLRMVASYTGDGPGARHAHVVGAPPTRRRASGFPNGANCTSANCRPATRSRTTYQVTVTATDDDEDNSLSGSNSL